MTSNPPTLMKRNGTVDNDDAPSSGLDEIESAFDRVSMAADALLDSIRDDSLRGKVRRRHNHQKFRSSSGGGGGGTTGSFDDDDDGDDDLDNYSFVDDYDTNPPKNKNDDDDEDDGDDDDDSSLASSVDGSLICDMKNLESVSQAIQKELAKEGEAFQEATKNHITTSESKLKAWIEARSAAATATNEMKSPNLKLKTTTASAGSKYSKKDVTTADRSWINNSNNIAKGEVDKTVQSTRTTTTRTATITPTITPTTTTTTQTVGPSPFLRQFEIFCIDAFGNKLNIPLLLLNMIVWIVFCKLLLSCFGGSDDINNRGILKNNNNNGNNNEGELATIGSLLF